MINEKWRGSLDIGNSDAFHAQTDASSSSTFKDTVEEYDMPLPAGIESLEELAHISNASGLRVPEDVAAQVKSLVAGTAANERNIHASSTNSASISSSSASANDSPTAKIASSAETKAANGPLPPRPKGPPPPWAFKSKQPKNDVGTAATESAEDR